MSQPFSQCLAWADRVILDYPATAFYEAAAANIPVLALYHKRIPVRESAKRTFGKSLYGFASVSEALEEIEKFANISGSDLNEYQPHLPLTAENTADQLIALRGSR